MFLGSGIYPNYSNQTAVVIPAGIDFDNTGDEAAGDSIVYSGVRFSSDGDVYRNTLAGAWQPAGTWLLDGTAGDYYLIRTINSGTFNQSDDGTLQQLNADLDYAMSVAVPFGLKEGGITFSISDDALGANIIATRTYTFYCELEGSGTPP